MNAALLGIRVRDWYLLVVEVVREEALEEGVHEMEKGQDSDGGGEGGRR